MDQTSEKYACGKHRTDNIPRNLWRKARVEEAYKNDDDLVRKVKLTITDPSLDRFGKRVRVASTLERPIQKLVLLQEADAKAQE